MFRKKPIIHQLKPDCKYCKHREYCTKCYDDCHKYSGFTEPCKSCKKIGNCNIYLYHVYRKRHVSQCPDWEYDDGMSEL